MAASAPNTLTFAIWGPIRRDDLQGLCDRVCALFTETRPDIAFCDVTGVEPDAVCVDALARLQLAARGFGCQVRLRNATPHLCGLIGLLGLEDVLPDG